MFISRSADSAHPLRAEQDAPRSISFYPEFAEGFAVLKGRIFYLALLYENKSSKNKGHGTSGGFDG